VTAKTAKERDTAQETDETTEAAETAEAGRTAQAGRTGAKKKVRRVRVIEVIDDEDLDEDLGDVLEAMDAATTTDETEAGARKDTRDRTDSKASAKARGDEADAEADRDTAGDSDRRGGVLAVFAAPWFTTVLVALVLAAVASWALVQWHSVSNKEKERQRVSAAATKFGDVVYSYNPAHIQADIDHNREMMAGDLLTSYMKGAGTYKQFFEKTKWTWTSKTSKVYISEVQGNLASAVIVIDVNMRMTEGPIAVPSAHFTLGLIKQKGAWKVSSIKAAGSEAASTADSGSTGGLPSLSGSQTSGGTAKDKKN
jgi:hypothetical protein